MNKVRKHTRRIAIGFLVLILIAAVAFKVYSSNCYREDKYTIRAVEEEFQGKVDSFSDHNGTVFIPKDQEIKAVIVFYPGGKVEYSAYSGFMYELAGRGIVCILPRMPENLAFLRIDAADIITRGYTDEVAICEESDWYLAGHSLGGVAASSYIAEHAEEYKGLILCASYPASDLSDLDLSLLSLYGTEDKVLNFDKYENSKMLWPEDSTEYAIEGGNHSYFGSYGLQAGDGRPTITNREQMQKAADIIVEWIEKSDVDLPDSNIAEDGIYDSKEDVASYLQTYGKLPSNYITKKEAKKLGWTGGSLEEYAPGMSIGGDYFGNYEGRLPEDKTYHECDIDTRGQKSRGSKRIVYSDDGYIYYTENHYETFELLYMPVG